MSKEKIACIAGTPIDTKMGADKLIAQGFDVYQYPSSKNPDEEIEKEILSVRSEHKDFGYRRLHAELVHNRNIHVNKKKVHRLVKKLKLQVTSYTNKSRKYNSYKAIEIGITFARDIVEHYMPGILIAWNKIYEPRRPGECLYFYIDSKYSRTFRLIENCEISI